MQITRKKVSDLLQAGRLQEALHLLTRSCQTDPEDPEAWYLLACTYERLSRLDKAESSLERAIGLRPEHPDAYRTYGRILELLHKDTAALDVYERLGKLQPGSLFAAGCMARIHERNGRHEAAWRAIKPIVNRGAGNVDVALVYARVCKHFGHCEDAIAYLSQGIAHPGISKQDRTRMRFHLGTLYDARGEYEKAFSCFSQANHEKGIQFDSQLHEENIGRVIEAFSGENIRQMPRAEVRSDRPVFIVGMPRSGTTLVEQILASHSGVYGGGELSWIPETVSTLAGCSGAATPYLYSIKDVTGPQVEQAAQEYLHRLEELSPDASRITDKQMLNFLNLGLINLLFPEARVIHCIRDAVDTCLSCYFQEFQEANDFTYDLAALGSFYVQHERLMRHWKAALNIPIMDVQYKELVENQEQITRSMVDFIGLDWEEQCLRFHDSGRLAKTASYDQVRQPMYTRSIERWKHYEKHLQPLKEALEQV